MGARRAGSEDETGTPLEAARTRGPASDEKRRHPYLLSEVSGQVRSGVVRRRMVDGGRGTRRMEEVRLVSSPATGVPKMTSPGLGNQ